eukprot:Phypoly_transcript_14210.p2 GENE.Phypoly_transcript_14210~~Phypoly_transcript_14210.p2  ORF type:complete len:111 (-),score=19.33 Phypoly_transcript_14210:228-560(-)
MDGLNKHNTIEHDASISRDDTYFGTGQGVNYTLIFGLIDLSKDGVLTQDDFGKWQGIRQRDSVRRNPDFTFGTTQQVKTEREEGRGGEGKNEKNLGQNCGQTVCQKTGRC